jgi:hypothetical protein
MNGKSDETLSKKKDGRAAASNKHWLIRVRGGGPSDATGRDRAETSEAASQSWQAGATGADNDDDLGPTVAWTADFEPE